MTEPEPLYLTSLDLYRARSLNLCNFCWNPHPERAWEEKSGETCLFIMPEGPDWAAIMAKIG